MNKIQGMTLTLAAALAVAAPTVRAEEDTKRDLKQLFYTYSKDNIVFDKYDDNYVYPNWKVEHKLYNGFLALEETDLNYDGAQELLAIRMKEKDGQNQIIAEIYEQQENKLQRITQYTLADGVLGLDTARIDVFLAETQAGKVICCEAADTAYVIADGTTYSFRAAGFDGSTLYEYQEPCVGSGSSWAPDETAPVYAALAGVGLYPANVVYNATVDQVSNVERLNTICRYEIVTYEEISDYMNSGSEEGLQYAETYFHSFVNEDLESKFPTEFAVVAAEQDAVFEDFVFPDSDERMITEAELDELSEYEIFIARNEIYARHGRIFHNEELNSYFSAKSWYQPTVDGDEFTEEYASKVFNTFEIQNISTMVQYEKAHGFNGY